MLVAEPTFVGGKMIKMLIFDIKNSKNVESFCTYFSIINYLNNRKNKEFIRNLFILINSQNVL